MKYILVEYINETFDFFKYEEEQAKNYEKEKHVSNVEVITPYRAEKTQDVLMCLIGYKESEEDPLEEERRIVLIYLTEEEYFKYHSGEWHEIEDMNHFMEDIFYKERLDFKLESKEQIEKP